MKNAIFGLTAVALAIGAFAACADSEDRGGPANDDKPAPLPDGAPPADAGSDARVADAAEAGSLCSPAGWCREPMPDSDLTLLGITSLENRAFVIAKTSFFGVKVLEWDGAAHKWNYIDDDTQNEPTSSGLPRLASTIWSPSDDEVYYAMTPQSPDAPGIVYYGKRPVPPATAWTWTQSLFPVCSYGALWVSGVGANDVYAGACAAIYRKGAGDSGDGGPPGWTLDRAENEEGGKVIFNGATGSGPDDVWFAGARVRRAIACGLALRKTSTGYETVVDSEIGPSNCAPRAGTTPIQGTLRSAQSREKGRLIALAESISIVRVAANTDGSYVLSRSKGRHKWTMWTASWATSEDEIYLTQPYLGELIRASEPFEDAATYKNSTIALDGVPTVPAMIQVRGTSKTNLWVIGGNYAYHKTTL